MTRRKIGCPNDDDDDDDDDDEDDDLENEGKKNEVTGEEGPVALLTIIPMPIVIGTYYGLPSVREEGPEQKRTMP